MKTRKIVALLLAVVMVMSLCISATAEDDTYSSYTFTALGLTLQVSNGTEGLTITGTGLSATIAPDGDNEMPQSLSLIFSNTDGTNFDTSDVTVTVNHAAIFEFYTEGTQDPRYGYGVVELNGDSTSLTIKRGDSQCLVNINAPTAQVAGTGIAAYLPAPGQFVNEGADSSGWGGVFTAKSASTMKNLVEGYVSTGVSLGAFGGYAVLDFGAIVRDADGSYVSGGIYNDPTNAYGVDFTLYGNAMSSWAEPGCVQVSQDGTTWYDLAGSLHYQTPSDTAGGAIWNYSATYTNPVPSDDTDITTGNYGDSDENVPYVATYRTRPASTVATESGSVLYNGYHKHNYFPLYNNYFVGVNGHTALDGLLNSITGLNLSSFGSYTATTSTAAATLTLNGVKLVPPKTSSGGNSTAPDDFLFGYVDCHPNGLRSGAQVNPYTTGRTGNSNSNGDPMDISWAVNANGEPVSLDAIRYVRVYTGVMQTNGVMGESSTELVGSHRATTKGATTTVMPTINIDGMTFSELEDMDVTISIESISSTQELITISGLSNAEVDTQYSLSATGGSNLCINGVKTNAVTLTRNSDTIVQVISQDGTANAFVTVLKIAE